MTLEDMLKAVKDHQRVILYDRTQKFLQDSGYGMLTPYLILEDDKVILRNGGKETSFLEAPDGSIRMLCYMTVEVIPEYDLRVSYPVASVKEACSFLLDGSRPLGYNWME